MPTRASPPRVGLPPLDTSIYRLFGMGLGRAARRKADLARLAAAAELWLGKPVLAINTATYWWALRRNGIADPVDGFGALLRDY